MVRFTKKFNRVFTLSAALFISLFLAIAAYGKLFHPAEKLQQLDTAVSALEMALIACLLVFCKRAWMWLIAAVIFGGWTGYAMYWCCLKLPCSCAGSLIAFPSKYALLLDVLFFVISIFTAYCLGVHRAILYSIFLAALLSSLIGYAFAEWAFYVKIVGVKWNLTG